MSNSSTAEDKVGIYPALLVIYMYVKYKTKILL